MQVISVISTKGGVGKTTIAANLGGFIADAGLRVLLLDLDIQPTLSSYYELSHRAPGGIYELLAFNERDISQLASRTAVERPGRHSVQRPASPVEHPAVACTGWQITAAQPPAGVRAALRPGFDRHPGFPQRASRNGRAGIQDGGFAGHTRNSRRPEMRRGTLQLIQDIAPYRHLGIEPPPLQLLINRVPAVSSNARLIRQTLRRIFREQTGVQVLDTEVPAIEAFPRAATQSMPAHRVEHRRPTGRIAPAALDIVRALATELCPHWRERFGLVTGKIGRRHSHVERP